MIQHAFSSDGSYFVQLSVDDKLLLFDTTTNSIKAQYGEKRRKFGKISCFKYFNQSKRLGSCLVATVDGSILLWNFDLNSFEILTSKIHSGNKVSDIAVSSDYSYFVSCSASDSVLLKFDLDTKKISHVQTKSINISRIEIVQDRYVLAAGDDIKLYDLDSSSLLGSFLGHATPVSGIYFASLKSNHLIFATIAEEDNLINFWSHELSLGQGVELIRKPKLSLACLDTPVTLALFSEESKNNVSNSHVNGNGKTNGFHSPDTSDIIRVVVSDRSFSSYVFDIDLLKESDILLKPSFRFVNDGFKVVGIFQQDDRHLKLASTKDESFTSWIFQRVKTKKLLKQKKDLIISLAPDAPTGTTLETEREEAKKGCVEKTITTMELEMEGKVAILHPEQHELNQINRVKRRRVNSTALEIYEKEIILANNNFQLVASSSASGTGVVTLLKQGLLSEDQKKIGLCLDQTTEELAERTLMALGSEETPEELLRLRRKLVVLLVKHYLSNPTKSDAALMWLNKCFRLFGKRMAADEEVFESLSRFYTAVNVRLKTKEKLSRLGGKVQFMVGHIEDNEGSLKKKNKELTNKNEAAIIYSEE